MPFLEKISQFRANIRKVRTTRWEDRTTLYWTLMISISLIKVIGLLIAAVVLIYMLARIPEFLIGGLLAAAVARIIYAGVRGR